MSNVQACLSFPGQSCGQVQHQEAKEGCQEVPAVCGEAGGEGGGAVPRPQQVRQDEQALETLHQQVAILCISQQGGILSFHPQVWVLRCPVQSDRPGGDCGGGPTVYRSHGKCGVPENR